MVDTKNPADLSGGTNWFDQLGQFPWAGAGTFLSGLSNIAGGINSLFSGPSTTQAIRPKLPSAPTILTPTYMLGSGQLTRLDQTGLGQTRDIMSSLKSLQGQVEPGFGRLTKAVTDQIRSQGAAAVGNLRAQLGQRDVLGASFANDSLARVQAEYDQQEATARANAFKDEMTASLGIINAQTNVQHQEAQRELSELNLTTDFMSKVHQAVDANAKMLAHLAGMKATSIVQANLAGAPAPAGAPPLRAAGPGPAGTPPLSAAA